MRYLTNADDFGRTETVNDAIVYGFDNGYLSRTTVMVNMPYYDEAIDLAKEHGFFDKVGLHINLTSGVPLTQEIKSVATIVGENGYFNGSFFGNKRMRFILTPKERKAVKAEIEAQIKKYIDSGFTLMHADSHGHVHTFVSLRGLILKALKKHEFNSIRISLNLNANTSLSKRLYKKLANRSFAMFSGKKGTPMFAGSYKAVLRNESKLKNADGECEIMLHPNYYEGSIVIGEALQYQALDKIKNQQNINN